MASKTVMILFHQMLGSNTWHKKVRTALLPLLSKADPKPPIIAASPPHPTRDLIKKRIKQRFSLIIVILALERSCIGEPYSDEREEGFAKDGHFPPPRQISLIQPIKPRLDGISDGVSAVMDEDTLEGIVGGA
jgi:hypothetical protein